MKFYTFKIILVRLSLIFLLVNILLLADDLKLEIEYHNDLIYSRVVWPKLNEQTIEYKNSNKKDFFNLLEEIFPEYNRYYNYFEIIRNDLEYYGNKAQDFFYIPENLEIKFDFDRDFNIEYYIKYQLEVPINYNFIFFKDKIVIMRR